MYPDQCIIYGDVIWTVFSISKLVQGKISAQKLIKNDNWAFFNEVERIEITTHDVAKYKVKNKTY